MARHLGPTQAQQLERTDEQPALADANQAGRELLNILQVAVTQLAASGRSRSGDGVLDRYPPVTHPQHSHILLGMARVEFASEVTVKCTPERAFDYFADTRPVAAVLEGVRRWEPIGAQASGLGARYNVEMTALGFPLKSVLRLNRWRRPHEIGWVSETGLIKQEGGFAFRKVPGGVHIELRIAYQPPASFLGAAIASRLDWTVKRRLKVALERIRDKLEEEPG